MKRGYSPEYGARALKRVLQRDLLNELSKAILGDTIDNSLPIEVDTDNSGNIVFHNKA